METISYVYDNAQELGIDKSNLVVTGEGTGATTAYSGQYESELSTSVYFEHPFEGVTLFWPLEVASRNLRPPTLIRIEQSSLQTTISSDHITRSEFSSEIQLINY